MRDVDLGGEDGRVRAVAGDVEVAGHARHREVALQSAALPSCRQVEHREIRGDHGVRLGEQRLEEGHHGVHRAQPVVVEVLVVAGGREGDQRRVRLDAVAATHVEVGSVGAVHLRHDDVRREGTLTHALSHALVERRQRLAPVAPGSEEVHEHHRLRGGDALEVRHPLDQHTHRLRPHHLLTTQILIQLHCALGNNTAVTRSDLAGIAVVVDLPSSNVLRNVDLDRRGKIQLLCEYPSG